jgi:transposase
MPRGRMEADAEVWRDRVQRWKQSGLTAKAFAELEGLPRAGALSWWKYQLSTRDKKALATGDESPLRLIRLEPTTPPASRAGRRAEHVVAPIEVTCGAYRIVVRAGFEPVMLELVLRAVERAR